ncbi:MAG: choice-of-anchor A family protein [Lewinella sp.]|nr:choice-of-anchor A family protein [Lewinella sp.]
MIANSINYSSGIFNINGGMTEKHVKLGNLNGGTVTQMGTNFQIFNAGKGIQISNTSQANGTFTGTGLFNVANAMTSLRSSSTTFSGCPNNVTPTYDSGNPNPKLTMAANTTNVWNITGAQLNGWSTITFNNQPTATQPLVVNVNMAGTFNWNVPIMAGVGRTNGARHIIWNFYNATTLGIQGNGMVIGSILAPNATINKTSSNNVEGQIACINFSQSNGEIHVAHFNANVKLW